MCLRSRLASWRRAQTNCYVLFLSCLPSSRPTRPWGDGRGSRLFRELADFHTAVILWEQFLPGGGGRKLIPVTGKMTHHSLAGFPVAASQQQGQSCARWVTLPSLPPAAGILAPLLPYSLTSKEALWREVSAQRAPGPGPGQSSPVTALAPGPSILSPPSPRPVLHKVMLVETQPPENSVWCQKGCCLPCCPKALALQPQEGDFPGRVNKIRCS